jgi:SAM-dependent methyltransferase
MSARQCPCCDGTTWREVRAHSSLRYLRCRPCGFETQLRADATAAEVFLAQQASYYGADAATIETAHPRLDKEVLATRLRVLHEFLPAGASVLEVGPGGGLLAQALQDEGRVVTLVEQSAVLAGRLRDRGFRVYEGEFETLALGRRRWNAFCSFHVIEHVPDVRLHLRAARDLVLPGGWAFIATPSADSWEHRLPGLSPNFDGAHLSIFSPLSLNRCLTQAGWEPVLTLTPEYATPWLRVVTKLVRRARGEHESTTAGKYASQGGGAMGAAINAFALISQPCRMMQSWFGKGNEVFVVARARA